MTSKISAVLNLFPDFQKILAQSHIQPHNDHLYIYTFIGIINILQAKIVLCYMQQEEKMMQFVQYTSMWFDIKQKQKHSYRKNLFLRILWLHMQKYRNTNSWNSMVKLCWVCKLMTFASILNKPMLLPNVIKPVSNTIMQWESIIYIVPFTKLMPTRLSESTSLVKLNSR